MDVAENIERSLIKAVRAGNEAICKSILDLGTDPNIISGNGKPILFIAVERGYYQIAELLLRRRANINLKSRDNLTPIFAATRRGDSKLFKLLIRFGATFDISMGKDNDTILHHFVENGWSRIVQGILKHRNVVKENFKDLMVAAVLNRNESIIQILRDYGFRIDPSALQNEEVVSAVIRGGLKETFADLLNLGLDNSMSIADKYSECDRHFSPFHLVVVCEYKDIIEMWINHGVDVNCLDSMQKSPLFDAVDVRNFDITELLISKGADVNSLDCDKMSPLMLAAKKGICSITDFSITEILIEKGAECDILDASKKSPLFYAVESDSIEIVNALLPKVDVHSTCDAFNLAVWSGNIDIVNAFLQNGYDLNSRDDRGRTALHYTAHPGNYNDVDCRINEKGRGQIAELLLRQGLDANIEMKEGLTTFLVALINENTEIVKTLLPHHPDINRTVQNYSSLNRYPFRERSAAYCAEKLPKRYCNFLHIATWRGASEIIELLLQWGARIDCKTEIGFTPLHSAVFTDDISTIQLLINYGANLNAKAINGMTPLHLSVLMKKMDSFKLLIDSGADVSAEDCKGQMIFDYFKKRSCKLSGMLVSCEDDFLNSNETVDEDDAEEGSDEDLDLELVEEFDVDQHNDDYGDDYFVDYVPDFIASFLEVASDFIKNYVVKLTSVSLKDEYKELLSPHLTSFEMTCKAEIVAMKEDILYECTDFRVTAYDILTICPRETAVYLQDKNFETYIQTNLWQEKYPFYVEMMKTNLRIAERKKNLFDEFEFVLGNFFPLYTNLPSLCKEKILNFIPPEELRRITTICNYFIEATLNSE